jgi:Protein of unknown function (DUF664)
MTSGPRIISSPGVPSGTVTLASSSAATRASHSFILATGIVWPPTAQTRSEAVERNWFQHYLGGKPREEITGNARGDAPSWDVEPGEAVADVIAEFDSACATSRQIAASFTLDQTVPRDELGQVSLRWIYVHIIREHARHLGHADILREQIDGVTGD